MQNLDQNKDISSVTAIIRNNSLGDQTEQKPQQKEQPENVEEKQEEQKSEKVSKERPELPPLSIPETNPSDNFDWGESTTPNANEQIKLSPLDDNAFDSPNNSMGETQLKSLLSRKHSTENEELKSTKSSEETQQSIENNDNKEILQLEERLKGLILQKDIILQNPPSTEREQAVSNLLYHIFSIKQQLKQHLESQQGKPLVPPSFLHQPMSVVSNQQPTVLRNNLQQAPLLSTSSAMMCPPVSSQPLSSQHIISSNLQQSSLLASASTGIINQQSIVTNNHLLQTLSSMPGMVNQPMLNKNVQQMSSSNLFPYPNSGVPMQPQQQQVLGQLHSMQTTNSEYAMKMQQLEAINRCLQMPSGLAGIQDLQNYKETIEQQLNQILQKENLQLLLQQQQQQQQQNHQAQSSLSSSVQSVLLSNEHMSKSDEGLLQKSGSELSSTDFLNEYNRETEQLGKQMILTSAGPTSSSNSINGHASPLEDERKKDKNSGTINSESKPKKGFQIPNYEDIVSESKATWTARELHNLQQEPLQHPKARFFSVLVHEYKEKFMPDMAKTYTFNELLIHEVDASIFRKVFDKPEGPIFLILRHKLLDGTWMVGCILQVMSKLMPWTKRKDNNRSGYQNFCRARFVSLAMASDLPWFRSDKSRELTQDVAYRYINLVIQKLKDGKSTTVFRYQEKHFQTVCTLLDNYFGTCSSLFF